ncbi:late embryogenesis abundant protein Lea5-like [Phoenix dactylifera]|uniref:Late embryogenesis abundant protein Lea5-like n=1 Tax=Phoenix dactylifera TaxID=42345 RepID=A0A8B7C1Q6_PHODC|nr:late embryogenesis abundant protein Lea5-like [Phoenix dactylifera]
MARALSNATIVAALSDGIALLAGRRGYSSAAAAVAGRRSRTVVEEKAAAAAMKSCGCLEPAAAPSSSWVPDPVTGYYRPANRAAETDPAELRAMLLKPKSQH